MNRLPILLALAMVSVTSQALAQQHISFSETGISFEIPTSWSTSKQWSLTDNMPAFGMHHVQNSTTGQYVMVHREHCPDAERRAAWANGELAAGPLDHPKDSLAALPGESAVVLPGSTGFLTIADRESVVYKSYAFFSAKGELCYLVEVGGPQELFEPSSATYQGLVDGLDLPE